jgi:hypothetical protein
VGTTAEAAREAIRLHAAGGRKPKGFEAVAQRSHHRRLAEPLSPARVGRFRKDLSKKQIRQVESIAQYGMQAYGYAMDTRSLHPLIIEDRISLLKASVRDLLNRMRQRLWGR